MSTIFYSSSANSSLRCPPSTEKKPESTSLVVHELRLMGIRMPSESKFKQSQTPTSLAFPRLDDTLTDTGELAVCFGRLLSDQPMCEVSGLGQVPTVLVACCDFLRSGHLSVEGLFRVEGSKTRLRDLRQRLERGCGIRDSTSPHDVCSVLKAWLRELPEPLVPPRIAYTLAEVAGQQASLERRARVLRLCSLLLSGGQLRALRYLCDFLGEVDTASPSNRMDAPNLAICLGPSLLQLHPDTPREVAHLNSAVALLLQLSEELGRSLQDLQHHQHSRQCERRRRSSGAIVGGALKAVGRAVSRLASRSRSRSPGTAAARSVQQQQQPRPSQSPSGPSTTKTHHRILQRLSAGGSGSIRRVAAAPTADDRPPMAPPRKLALIQPLPPQAPPSSSASLMTGADKLGAAGMASVAVSMATPPPPPPLSTLPSCSALRTPLNPHNTSHQHQAMRLQLSLSQSQSGSPGAPRPVRAVHNLPLMSAAVATAVSGGTVATAAFCATPVRTAHAAASQDSRRHHHFLTSGPQLSLQV